MLCAALDHPCVCVCVGVPKPLTAQRNTSKSKRSLALSHPHFDEWRPGWMDRERNEWMTESTRSSEWMCGWGGWESTWGGSRWMKGWVNRFDLFITLFRDGLIWCRSTSFLLSPFYLLFLILSFNISFYSPLAFFFSSRFVSPLIILPFPLSCLLLWCPAFFC